MGPWFGVDGDRTENRLDYDADISYLPQLERGQWPVSCYASGSEYLVRLFKPPSSTPVSHRLEAGLRLGADAVAGLTGVDGSILTPAVNESHPARGRGIEIVVWKAVLGSPSRGNFCCKIGEGSWVERKGSSAPSRHRFGMVVALLRQSDVHSSYATWLRGMWVVVAFPVPPDGAAAAAGYDAEVALLSRTSAVVKNANEV